MNVLVQAEMSVLVDILYRPEVLFHSSLPVSSGFSSGGFMTKYEQILLSLADPDPGMGGLGDPPAPIDQKYELVMAARNSLPQT